MHKYLKCIGFEGFSDEELLKTIRGYASGGDLSLVKELKDGRVFLRIPVDREGKACLSVVLSGDSHVDYCYPYAEPNETYADMLLYITKHFYDEAYSFVVDGIYGEEFYGILENAPMYEETISSPNFYGELDGEIAFAGFMLGARIILPVGEEFAGKSKEYSEYIKGHDLYNQDSDEEIDKILALGKESMDSFTDLMNFGCDSTSAVYEGIFPLWNDKEMYEVIATVVDYKRLKNEITGQDFYYFSTLCRGLPINICVDCDSIEGEIMVGRRIKGNMLLMGKLVGKVRFGDDEI